VLALTPSTVRTFLRRPTTSGKVPFGEAPKPAREVRALPNRNKLPKRCANTYKCQARRAALTHEIFFAELTRRNVYKVAVAYAVVSGLLK
jgi:hypothetical protein